MIALGSHGWRSIIPGGGKRTGMPLNSIGHGKVA